MKISTPLYLSISGYLLIAIGVIHAIAHFLFKTPSNIDELKMYTALLQHHVQVLGGVMSLEDILDGLNLMYSLFLISTGAITRALVPAFDRGRGARAFLVTMSGVFFVGAIISIVYFVWFHVVYFLIFAILFGVLGSEKRSL